jgi:hypothetical protein
MNSAQMKSTELKMLWKLLKSDKERPSLAFRVVFGPPQYLENLWQEAS